MKKKVIFFMEILLVAVIVFQGYKIYENMQTGKQYKSKIEEVNNILDIDVRKNEKREKNKDTHDEKISVRSLEKLKNKYENVIAIIDIPGTDVRYPVLQAKDNQYYLNHDINKKNNSYGEVFLDYRNNSNFEDGNSIVYGHNVESEGVIFNNLLKYKEQGFYDRHKNVYIITDKGVKKFRVISSYIADPYYSYRNTGFESKDEKAAFLKRIIEKSIIAPDLKGFEGGKTDIFTKNGKIDLDIDSIKSILTLSTCEDDNHRMVVQCISDWR